MQVIASYQISAFITPANATTGDADQVRGNDNTLRASFNSHDGDAGIHFQGSTLAERPVAGTLGRKWMATDSRRIYVDDGSSWQEIAYLAATAGPFLPIANGAFTGTITGPNITLSGNITASTGSIAGTLSFTAAASVIDATGGSGLTVKASNAGGSITYMSGGTNRWQMGSTGHFIAMSDGAYDIGAVASGRPRTVYAATSVVSNSFAGPEVRAAAQLDLIATGASQIRLSTNGTARWDCLSTGDLRPVTDLQYKIGDATHRLTEVHAEAYKVGGTQVVSGRQTAWVAMTGAGNAGGAYDVATVTLAQLAGRVKAIQDAMTTHGLIGP